MEEFFIIGSGVKFFGLKLFKFLGVKRFCKGYCCVLLIIFEGSQRIVGVIRLDLSKCCFESKKWKKRNFENYRMANDLDFG